MATVLAAVMPAPHVPVELREFREPELEPGSALLSTLYSEVCGTDVHLWHGRLAGVPYPIIPGHVSVGRVAATGGEVRDVDGIPIEAGQVVTFLAAGCGLPTALHALALGEIQFGDTVLVQGSGPVGLSAAILAQLRGAGKVIVTGGPPLRLEMARRLGADAAIDIGATSEPERRAIVRELTGGRGADVTIEATGVAAA